MSENQTLVPMNVMAGMSVPTLIHLPDASTIYPDATGKIMCPSAHVTTLMNAGWQISVAPTTATP